MIVLDPPKTAAGEFDGVRRCERCLEADFLNSLGDNKGEGEGLEDGQDIVYPAGMSAGWMSKLRSQTPACILEKYSAKRGSLNRWYRSWRLVK